MDRLLEIVVDTFSVLPVLYILCGAVGIELSLVSLPSSTTASFDGQEPACLTRKPARASVGALNG